MIDVAIVDEIPPSVDTREDLEHVRNLPGVWPAI